MGLLLLWWSARAWVDRNALSTSALSSVMGNCSTSQLPNERRTNSRASLSTSFMPGANNTELQPARQGLQRRPRVSISLTECEPNWVGLPRFQQRSGRAEVQLQLELEVLDELPHSITGLHCQLSLSSMGRCSIGKLSSGTPGPWIALHGINSVGNN